MGVTPKLGPGGTKGCVPGLGRSSSLRVSLWAEKHSLVHRVSSGPVRSACLHGLCLCTTFSEVVFSL